jgi:hypothetical protein
MTIVPTNEFFKLDALAVFRDLASAILFHAHNLGEFRRTRNLAFGLTRCGGLCPPAPENETRRARLRIDKTARRSTARIRVEIERMRHQISR